MAPKFRPEDYFVGTVTVGERGQVVIPAEARKKLDIHTGDRLLMMSHPSQDGIMILKIDAMREFLDHLTMSLNVAEAGEATGRGGVQDDA